VTVLRQLDLVVLVLALPVFLAAGFPAAGYVTGAVAWVAQKVIKHLLEQRAAASDDPRTVVGLIAGSMVARGWLAAITIFAGYLLAGRDDEVGLAAALLLIVLFTTYFTVSLFLRPFHNRELPS
jgi:hypothetical protein